MTCARCHGLMGREPRAEIDYDPDLPWRQAVVQAYRRAHIRYRRTRTTS